MDTSICDKKIVKITDNNVVVKMILYNKIGEEILIDEKSYGQNDIDAEKKKLMAELSYWKYLNQNDIDKIIEAKQTEFKNINDIQIAMDGV